MARSAQKRWPHLAPDPGFDRTGISVTDTVAARSQRMGLRKRIRRLNEAFRTKRLYRDAGLSITALPGQGETLIVIFGSLAGGFAKDTHIEFAGTASGRGARHSLFVRDLRRRWFQDPGVMQKVVETVESYREANGLTRTLVMGDSMGAYGAVVHAAALDAEVCLAFGPQYDVDPAMTPGDQRWLEYRDAIPHFALGAVPRWMSENVSYYILHGRLGVDILHWSRFPQGLNIHHFIQGGMHHTIAPIFKADGRLQSVFNAALANDVAGFEALMSQNSGVRRMPGEGFLTHPNDWYQSDDPAARLARQKGLEGWS